MEITIREIQESDLLEVEKLYFNSIKQNVSGFIQRLDLLPDIKDVVCLKKRQEDAFFCLKVHQEIAGICGLVGRDNAIVELSKFHIKQKYQNQGLGKKFLVFMQEYARKQSFKKITLHVSKTQKPAIALYKKSGFSIVTEKDCIVNLDNMKYCYPTIFMQKKL